MENNTDNNLVNDINGAPTKKKSGLIIIIIIILLAIVALIYVKKMDKAPAPQNLSEVGLEQALTKDTTTSINSSLDSISIEDTTDIDLQAIDQELEKL